jgi:zinc transporter
MTLALVRDKGQVREMSVIDAADLTGHDLLWVHCSGSNSGELQQRLAGHVPDSVLDALVAVETRPRCEAAEGGVLLNLRVPALDDSGPDILVSVRIWAVARKIVTVSLRPSPVVDAACAAMRAGALSDPGDVIIAIVAACAGQLDPVIAQLGDDLDRCESDLETDMPFALRREVAKMRSRAISYRRFIGPQRTALTDLALLPLPWIDADERATVRDAADRFARMAEELESVRERASVVQDELTAMRAERIDSRSLQISIAAMIFLPLTFITGLLGMNVQGIPYADEQWAFYGVTAFCILVAAAVAVWFTIQRWSSR